MIGFKQFLTEGEVVQFPHNFERLFKGHFDALRLEHPSTYEAVAEAHKAMFNHILNTKDKGNLRLEGVKQIIMDKVSPDNLKSALDSVYTDYLAKVFHKNLERHFPHSLR